MSPAAETNQGRTTAAGQPARSAAAFPSLEWFQGFAAFLEGDEDFNTHCRWLRAEIAFRVDQTAVSLTVDRAMVLQVAPGLDAPDILLSGTRDQWAVLFDTDWGLNRLYRSSVLQIRADTIDLMRNWKALFFIANGMKRHGAG